MEGKMAMRVAVALLGLLLLWSSWLKGGGKTANERQAAAMVYPLVSSRNNDEGKSKDQFHHLLLEKFHCSLSASVANQ